MSNSAVGSIYASIIDKIATVAQNDFEEAGLEQETLFELKQAWQQNVSKMHVAVCPWDPPPPQPQIANPPTVPSNVKAEPMQSASQQSRNAGSSGDYKPQIKQEPKYEGGAMNTYAQPNGYHQNVEQPTQAQQRASALLQAQYGNQAQASIQATGLPPHQQRPVGTQQRPTHIQLPPNGHQQQRPQQSAQQQQYSQHSGLSAAQTDGADDGMAEWTAILAERRARHEEDRIAADGLLHAQMEKAAAFTDSGLMMPLREHPSTNSKKRKNGRLSAMPMTSVAETPESTTSRIPQMDGGDDDDDDDQEKRLLKLKLEADEDAINSDLDDSDDENDNAADDDDGPMGETILCTYDKVQRVKNKWKCTLKDGILTTGGREYVFHKAQGEFEW